MRERVTNRSGAAGRPTRTRHPVTRPGRSGPATPVDREMPAEVRSPGRTEWPEPLTEEERRALEAGWGFVE